METTPKFVVVKPPQRLTKVTWPHVSVFLAGSIEMGAAEDWQQRITEELSNIDSSVIVYNPRRDDWDPTWEQSIEHEQFNEQVTWELDHLDRSDVIVLYFDPATKSPISLMELGLYAKHDIIVYCPHGFWRKGNVDIVCKRFNIPVFVEYEKFVDNVVGTIVSLGGSDANV